MDVDEKCLTLQRNPTEDKQGRIRYETIGYFNNWEQVFDRLLKILISQKIEQAKVVTLTELKQIFIVAKNEVRDLLRDYIKISYCKELQKGREAS